jgi:hypothetical protein
MIPEFLRKEAQIIRHLSPPWGFDSYSAHAKGLIGRGHSKEEALEHLCLLLKEKRNASEVVSFIAHFR